MNQLRANIQFSAGDLQDLIMETLTTWQNNDNTQRLWNGDASLWTGQDEYKWLGWLQAPIVEQSEVPRIEDLSHEINQAGFTDIVLLGMGGSSLCPAMMAKTFDKTKGYPSLQVLDSTDPQQILHLEESLNLKKTFFIVSSKSGGTLEPNILMLYFYTRLQNILSQDNVGGRFLAITDPGSSLETMAKEDHFKTIFYGVPSIGGRYSALSNFGMVPSGLMGVDIRHFLQYAEEMMQTCLPSVEAQQNPGVLLGVILGICAKHGKDKVTLIVSPGIASFGAWLEQLLAESTGKTGKGLIPVDQETLGTPQDYGQDRVFVYIRLDNKPDHEQDRKIAELQANGMVVVRLSLPDEMHLGAGIFLWEIATAVAGSILGINAFNQPDVESSKTRTVQLTTEYERTGKLSQPEALFADKKIQLFTDEKNAYAIKERLIGEPSVENYLRAHLSRIQPGDYVDISAFIEMTEQNTALLQESRMLIRDGKKVATCLGFGPRFLHSTGQAYKGGPNTGVFLQITADQDGDLQVPDHRYTFGLVIAAQAQGDFEVLAERSRRVLRVHLGKNVEAGLRYLHELIQDVIRAS